MGMDGALLHLLGDVLNNLGVICGGLIMMLLKSPTRYYADPGISVGIALMIICGALPLSK